MVTANELHIRREWGEPMEYDDDVLDNADFYAKDIPLGIADPWDGHTHTVWQSDAETLTMEMLGLVLKGSGIVVKAIMDEDSTVTVGELAFVAARYPKVFDRVKDNAFASQNFFNASIRIYRKGQLDTALAWLMLKHEMGKRWSGYIPSNEIINLHEYGYSFDFVLPYIDMGVSNSELIKRIIDEDLDPALVASLMGRSL